MKKRKQKKITNKNTKQSYVKTTLYKMNVWI